MTGPQRVAVVCWLILALAMAAGPAPASAMTFLTMGTGKPGGNYYAFGQAFAQAINAMSANSGIRIKAVASEGSVDNINGLESGKYQLAIAQADMVYLATKGEGHWQKAGPQKSIRSVYEIYTEAVTCVATVASGIKQGRDLKGKRVALGAKGSGTQANALQVLSFNMLRPSDLGQALEVDPAQAMRLMYQGKLDAFFYTIGHPNQTIKSFLKHYGQARLVALPPTEGMMKQRPYYVEYNIWASDYPAAKNKGGKTPTFGIESYLVSSDKVPAKVVYEVTRMFLANLDQLKKRLKVMQEVKYMENYRIKDKSWTAPYHDGMVKLCKDVGLL